MSDNITKSDVKHVAQLAKLSFDDDQLEAFTGQLRDILDIIDTLQEVDTSQVNPTYSVTHNTNVLREDVADNWQQTDDLVQNAPEAQDTLIKVPAILED